MIASRLLVAALCLSLALAACDRRRQQNEVTQSAPATEVQMNAPTTAAEQPPVIPTAVLQPTGVPAATQPPAPDPSPAATPTPEPAVTAAPETDPLGDEIETLLQQLDDANATAESEIEQLPNP